MLKKSFQQFFLDMILLGYKYGSTPKTWFGNLSGLKLCKPQAINDKSVSYLWKTVFLE